MLRPSGSSPRHRVWSESDFCARCCAEFAGKGFRAVEQSFRNVTIGKNGCLFWAHSGQRAGGGSRWSARCAAAWRREIYSSQRAMWLPMCMVPMALARVCIGRCVDAATRGMRDGWLHCARRVFGRIRHFCTCVASTGCVARTGPLTAREESSKHFNCACSRLQISKIRGVTRAPT